MVFPYDVRGSYRAPERDIGASVGLRELRSVTAKVTRDTITFRKINRPKLEGRHPLPVEVYSRNKDSTGYQGSEGGRGTTEKATVRIDGSKYYGPGRWDDGRNQWDGAPTPIVFTGTGKTLTLIISGGTESTPGFTFDYLIPHMDNDEPWTFSKTTNHIEDDGEVNHEAYRQRDREVGYEEYMHDPNNPFKPGAESPTSEVAINFKQEDLYGPYHEVAFDQKVMLVLSKDKLVVLSCSKWSDEVVDTYKVTKWCRYGNQTGVKAGGWIIAIKDIDRNQAELGIIHVMYKDFSRWEIIYRSGDHGEYPGDDNKTSLTVGRVRRGPSTPRGCPLTLYPTPSTF